VRVFAFWLGRHGVRMEAIRARIEGARAQRGLAACRSRGLSAGYGRGRTCASSHVERGWVVVVASAIAGMQSVERRAQSAECLEGTVCRAIKVGAFSRGPSGRAARDRVCVTGRDRVGAVD
jgi:hypothetical protein